MKAKSTARERGSDRRQPGADRESHPAPVSPAQARIWAIQQRHPEATVFHLPFALRLSGKLHPGALTRTLTELGQRHESLRTTFDTVDGEVTALVHPTFNLTVPIIPSDTNPRSPGAALPLFAYQVLEEVRRPFDLARGPLLRARLFTFAADDRVLVLTLHRLIGDEASVAILEQEVIDVFTGHVTGERLSLPPLSCQASDLVTHQRQLIESDEGARQRAYWTGHLAGLTPLRFPADRPRAVWRTNHVARVQRPVPAALRHRLERFARSASVPAETTLLAAVLTLLAGTTGQDDVAVASRVSGRDRPGAERVVANLANTVVIRADLGGDPGFREVMRRVQQARDAAYRHQDLPFEWVMEALCPDQPPDLAEFVPVSVNWVASPILKDADRVRSAAGRTRLEPMPLDGDEALTELAITLDERADGWRVTLTYASDLYSAELAAELLERLLALLDRATRDPEIRRSALSADDQFPEIADPGDPGLAPDGQARPGVTVVPARASLVPLCNGDERRLTAYLCAGGSGNASMLGHYQTQFERLALDRPVYAFLAARNPSTTDGHAWTEAIAATHVREMRRRQPEGPYLLLGSCLGGILTMAMAQHMVDAGFGLPHVVLLDSRHPALGHMGPEEVWRDLTPPAGQRRSLQIGNPPVRTPAGASVKPTRDRPSLGTPTLERNVGANSETGGATSDAADSGPDTRAFFEQLLYEPRYLRLKQYRPTIYPGPVTVLANRDWLTRYPALGWLPPAVGELHLYEIPGDHQGFLADSLDRVGEVLRPLLIEFDRAR